MKLISALFARIEGMVDPFADYPAATPDKRPWRYFADHLRPFRRVMIEAGILGAIVALLELGLIWYAGRLVDLMSAGPGTFWADHGGEVLLAALFLLLLRPIAVGLNAAILFTGISTNMLPQVRWRAHRHMLGQPVGFFQNDFAGRLSNRVMNVGVAVEDTTVAVQAALEVIEGLDPGIDRHRDDHLTTAAKLGAATASPRWTGSCWTSSHSGWAAAR